MPRAPVGAAELARPPILAVASSSKPKPATLDPLPLEFSELVGHPEIGELGPDDTLVDVAYRHGVGFEALRRLNPDVDVWLPAPGTKLHLPTQMVLPHGPRTGIVINVAEMRLYDFTVGPVPEVYAISIGEPKSQTPIGTFSVTWKKLDPIWNVPESIQRERPGLPVQVPPGPDNPLGPYWLSIGGGFGIHGTNSRWSIGRMATHGCIRLYNRDIQTVFDRVDIGTKVRIVYQTVKFGRQGNTVFLEAHPDLYDRLDGDRLSRVLVQLRVLGVSKGLDREAVERALRERRGVPVAVGTFSADSTDERSGSTE